MDNALLISRLTVGIFPLKKEICDVNELIEVAKEKINFAGGAEKIRIHKDENIMRILAEKDIFVQAIANVLLSALENSKDAGEIDVQLSPGEIIVRHKGINFVDDDLGRMFDKFYRSQASPNEKFGGELFVAKGIIKAHEGKIVVKNQEAGGFLLSITFPLVDIYVNNLRLKNERV